MFERFTERARQIIVLAQQHAREFESEEIGVEHLLLACLTEEEGAAARVLSHLNVSESSLRDTILFGTAGKQGHNKQLPFTAEAKDVLEQALREALALGHNYIGTEHILLGIVRRQPDVVNVVASPEVVRNETLRYLSGPKKVASKPLTVSFDIKAGEVWVDPEGVSWYVKFTAGNEVHLERTLTHAITARNLVRKWRKMGDPHD